MTSTIAPTADQQLKAKHRALWASGTTRAWPPS